MGCTAHPRVAEDRRRRQPSDGRQIHGAKTWLLVTDLAGFLRNEIAGIAAIHMFVVLSATFRLLFVALILVRDQRKLVQLNITRNPDFCMAVASGYGGLPVGYRAAASAA